LKGACQRLVGELENRERCACRLISPTITHWEKRACRRKQAANIFLEVHLPRNVDGDHRGGSHQPDSRTGRNACWVIELTIVDPRTAFATPGTFSQASRCFPDGPTQALQKIQLDRWTAFVALTHDPKIDDPAIVAALKAGCF